MNLFHIGESQDINAADAFALRSPVNMHLDQRYQTLSKEKACVSLQVAMQSIATVPLKIPRGTSIRWKILVKYYSVIVEVKTLFGATMPESKSLLPAVELMSDGIHTGVFAADAEDLDVTFTFDNTQSLFSKALLYCFEPLSTDLGLDDHDVFDTGVVHSTIAAQDRFSVDLFIPKHHSLVYKIQCYHVDVSIVDKDGKVLQTSNSGDSGLLYGSLSNDADSHDKVVSLVVDNSKSGIFNWRSLSHRVLIGPRSQIESFDSGPLDLDVERWTTVTIPFYVPKHKAVTWKVQVKSQFSLIPSEIGVGINRKLPRPEKTCGVYETDEIKEYKPVVSKSCTIAGFAPEDLDGEYFLVLDNSGHINLSTKELSYRIIVGDIAFKSGSASDMMIALTGTLPGIAVVGEVFFVVLEALRYLGSTVSSQLKNDYALSWVVYMVYSTFPSPLQKTVSKQEITNILTANRNLLVIMIDETDENARMAKVMTEIFPQLQEIFETIKSRGVEFVSSLTTIDKLVDTVHGQLPFPVNKIITKKALTDFVSTTGGKEMFSKLQAGIKALSVSSS